MTARVLIVSGVSILIAAGSASGARLEITGYQAEPNSKYLSVNAFPGEVNVVTLGRVTGPNPLLVADRLTTPNMLDGGAPGCVRPPSTVTTFNCDPTGYTGAGARMGDLDDRMTATGAGVRIRASGGSGTDTLLGATTGRNFLEGDSGNDTIKGGNSIDTLGGGTGQDTINAGDGGDKIDGGAGKDVIYGEAGNDRIRTATRSDRQGRDIVDCGAGDEDKAIVDRQDIVRSNCEIVTRVRR